MLQGILDAFRWLFSATLPAGRLFGIPLRVHVILVAFMVWTIVDQYQFAALAMGTVWGIVLVISSLAVTYLSILAHEFGHAWGHRLVGGRTEMILLTPIGGVAMGSGAEASPRAELIVVALGPLVSVLLAGAGYLGYRFLPQPEVEWQMALWWIVMNIYTFNLMLACFNLLFPLFPMDSARLLRAGLSLKFNPQAVTLKICNLGLVLGAILIFAMFIRIPLPLIGTVSPWLGLIGLLGVQSCLYERERIKVMDVYTKSDNWGGRTVYYDQELVGGAKARASQDLGGFLKSRSLAGSKGKTVTVRSAKVIDIAPAEPAPTAPVEEITNIEELNRLMRKAANDEDFQMAARIKRRLRELS